MVKFYYKYILLAAFTSLRHDTLVASTISDSGSELAGGSGFFPADGI